MTLPLAQFLAVWVFLGLNIASPGPNVLNTIASAMGSGRRAGMGSALAVGFGVVRWCLGMSLGMAAVFAAVPAAQAVLTLVAASSPISPAAC
jgi:threonine/homoserine/homoserine lactone efflux protein